MSEFFLFLVKKPNLFSSSSWNAAFNQFRNVPIFNFLIEISCSHTLFRSVLGWNFLFPENCMQLVPQ